VLKKEALLQVEKIYSNGGNITQFINQMQNSKVNSKEAIQISYDYQAGSYVEYYKTDSNRHKYNSSIACAQEIAKLGSFDSILEAGVGEATGFRHVVENICVPTERCYGFDISWSRIRVAKDFLAEYSCNSDGLFVADLSNIPMKDNSIDLVYTFHSVEPNGGNEKPILEELYRIAKKYLVLFEPDFDLSNDEGKKRMESHGYIKNLPAIAKKLGYNVVRYEPFPYIINPLNPTSIIVIQKQDAGGDVGMIYQCPLTKTELVDYGEIFFSTQARLMYPVVSKIPILLDSYAILGNKYGM